MEGRGGFARALGPAVFDRLRACGLDVTYHRARGDYVYTREAADTGAEGPAAAGADSGAAARGAADPDGEIAVLDFAGGFGTGIFGHNHPELARAWRDLLDRECPFMAQASVREPAGRLAEALAARAKAASPAGEGAEPGYYVTLASTGAEAVEAAIKHAALERRRRLEALAAASEEAGRDRPDGGRAHARALRELADAPPLFLALEGGFHGKTTGALGLTHTPAYREPWRALAPRVHALSPGDERALDRALDDATRRLVTLEPGGREGAREVELDFVDVAAIVAEPIQGEGGIAPLSPAYLRALREAADRGGFPLVFDEIQSGLGRAGAFFASAGAGARGDYMLLAKALGGGMAKISALLIRADRYLREFGLLHSSTFAQDEPACEVALAALSILDRDDLASRCAALGDHLLARAREVATRYPDVVADVRGRGLMVGVEIADLSDSRSPLLRALSEADQLGFAFAGYLLHREHIRAIPTLSAPRTLRVEPSAYIDREAIDRFAAALERACAAARAGDALALAGFLARRDSGLSRRDARAEDARPTAGDRGAASPGAAAHGAAAQDAVAEGPAAHGAAAQDAVAEGPAAHGAAAETDTQIGFLAHFLEPGDLRRWDGALAPLTDLECERLLGRVAPALPPFRVGEFRLRSPAGVAVRATILGLALTPAHAMESMRRGEGAWALELIDRAVGRARDLGCRVLGFGGYTSILTQSCADVRAPPGVTVTTGNGLTAAAAAEALFEAAARRRLGALRVGVVGAAGNLGAVLSELCAERTGEVEDLLLVGRPRARRRLERVRAGLPDGAPARVSTDLDDLRACNAVIAATNAPSPIVGPGHVGEGPVVLSDVATPGDVEPGVARARPNATILRGGRVRAPMGQSLAIAGFGLAPGELYGCLAETIVLGLSGASEAASRGPLRADRARQIRDLARAHGFSLGE